MKLTKKENDYGHIIYLEDGDKYLSFSYQGNLDLYWTLHNRNGNINKDNTFTITKDNYRLFELFEKLYSDIENINIFGYDNEIPFYLHTNKEIKEYLKEKERKRKEEIKRYKEYNMSHYNDLFKPQERKIVWYSDETSSRVSNYLEIIKEDESYLIKFNIQEHIDGYDRDFNTDYYIPIRFRNSGSSYDPLNCIFMRMYNDMKVLDDINDIGHQIHIEEYLYQKQLVKKRK